MRYGKLKSGFLIAQKEANRHGDLIRRDFNNERTYPKCSGPKLGSWAINCSYDECDGYICGWCLLKNRRKNKTKKEK